MSYVVGTLAVVGGIILTIIVSCSLIAVGIIVTNPAQNDKPLRSDEDLNAFGNDLADI